MAEQGMRIGISIKKIPTTMVRLYDPTGAGEVIIEASSLLNLLSRLIDGGPVAIHNPILQRALEDLELVWPRGYEHVAAVGAFIDPVSYGKDYGDGLTRGRDIAKLHLARVNAAKLITECEVTYRIEKGIKKEKKADKKARKAEEARKLEEERLADKAVKDEQTEKEFSELYDKIDAQSEPH